jgi:hypothetical protein
MCRPTKYKEEYADQAFKLCLLGATDAEMADFFGVDESTINNWKIKQPEFLESIKKGKLKADAEVADSLHKRAKGYQYDEITYEMGMETKRVTKEVSPDTGAAMAWLKNRRPKDWRDKQEIESSNTNLNTDLTSLSAEDRRKRIDELMNKRNGK